MDDFNQPGSNKSQMDDAFVKFNYQWQLKNVVKLLKGEMKHYVCSDKTTTHEKIVIEYNHSKK